MSIKGRITAQDVARLAGVSQSAVSRVFTPGASVSPATVKKVRTAAETLGYRPDALARAMITGRSRIIGLVVAYLENMFYPLAIEKLSRALQARGYHVLIFMAENATENVSEVVRELIDYRVDGIITASVSMSNELTGRLAGQGIPVVNFNRGQENPQLTDITSDNVSGGRRATEHLIAAGHRRIAHIMGWQGSSTGRDRAEGFRQAMAAAGLEPVAMVDGMYARDVTIRVTRELFERPDRPDALFVGNDHMAFAAMDELRFGLGLSLPGDVSVIGYDDVPMAAWPAYDLTTIRQPVNRMVSATVEAILGLIEGVLEPQKTFIDGPLVVRGSTRQPPADPAP
ncbi:LacI family DNA-binding transcriptional regulator [Pararhodobacter zhoushanensis]|uniref:LacI family DNA-binding transcriptional regulator n=1 Tax=Pararhodobacter zhoushanensis TaxID=2479545 RepID=UPI000F8E34BB|nr:LacI family DNA-binding transcriptional regulator [Pararhodobacter zhoushanensis]